MWPELLYSVLGSEFLNNGSGMPKAVAEENQPEVPWFFFFGL
jgi:hypothetical protein